MFNLSSFACVLHDRITGSMKSNNLSVNVCYNWKLCKKLKQRLWAGANTNVLLTSLCICIEKLLMHRSIFNISDWLQMIRDHGQSTMRPSQGLKLVTFDIYMSQEIQCQWKDFVKKLKENTIIVRIENMIDFKSQLSKSLPIFMYSIRSHVLWKHETTGRETVAGIDCFSPEGDFLGNAELIYRICNL